MDRGAGLFLYLFPMDRGAKCESQKNVRFMSECHRLIVGQTKSTLCVVLKRYGRTYVYASMQSIFWGQKTADICCGRLHTVGLTSLDIPVVLTPSRHCLPAKT
jgi:hypothetical protein